MHSTGCSNVFHIHFLMNMMKEEIKAAGLRVFIAAAVAAAAPH